MLARVAASKFWLLTLVGVIVGCTDAKITYGPKLKTTSNTSVLNQIVSANGTFELKAPNEPARKKSFVIFLDMSFSMLAAGCDNDVNLPEEPENPVPGSAPVKAGSPAGNCTKAHLTTGRDPDGLRFDLVVKWLKDFEKETSAKFLLVPFTGGVVERNKSYKPEFTDYATLVKAVEALRKEQETDKKVFSDNSVVASSMGTSVPINRLTQMTDAVYEEMSRLKASGDLASTTFEIMYVSDGVPAPTAAHYTTALNLVQLVDLKKSCNPGCALDGSKCKPLDFEDNGRCKRARDEMADLWGEVRDNQIADNVRQWKYLLNTPNIFTEGATRLHLVMLNGDKNIPRENTPATNFLQALRSALPTAKFSDVKKSDPPYSLVDQKTVYDRYTIKSAFAVNTNVRVNQSGQLDVDSDGDGLFDTEEASRGTDSRNPRSLGSGLCLDSIAVQATYKERCMKTAAQLECDPQLDADGDGLNECEEKILGTSPKLVDSDGDGIPDGLEVVYGLNPTNSDETLDIDGDGNVNLIHFQKGLPPTIAIKSVIADWLVNFERKFLGFKTGADGVARATYEIALRSFPFKRVPLGSKVVETFDTGSHSPQSLIAPEMQVVSGPVLNVSNQLIIFASIVSAQRPDHPIWMMKKVSVGEEDRATPVKLDLSSMKMMSRFDK